MQNEIQSPTMVSILTDITGKKVVMRGDTFIYLDGYDSVPETYLQQGQDRFNAVIQENTIKFNNDKITAYICKHYSKDKQLFDSMFLLGLPKELIDKINVSGHEDDLVFDFTNIIYNKSYVFNKVKAIFKRLKWKDECVSTFLSENEVFIESTLPQYPID